MIFSLIPPNRPFRFIRVVSQDWSVSFVLQRERVNNSEQMERGILRLQVSTTQSVSDSASVNFPRAI